LEQQTENSDGDADSSLPTAVISLRIMEALASTVEECGITNLSVALGMPKARVHRHLSALKTHGYVTQNPSTNRYSIGWRLYLLGQNLVKRFEVVPLSKPIMEELRNKIGQTIVITTFTENEVAVLSVVPGKNALEIVLQPGAQFDLNAAAQGKVVLAFGPDALFQQVLSRPLKQNTSHTIVEVDRLKAEIDLVRERGWADAPEQLFLGINALAAPIFLADGTLFGSLAAVGSIHYLPVRPLEETVSALLDAAQKISGLLGFSRSRARP
jgi:DNA-binding IclR family transcriptional regulator